MTELSSWKKIFKIGLVSGFQVVGLAVVQQEVTVFRVNVKDGTERVKNKRSE